MCTVINKITKEKKFAVYATNRKGNMQFNIDGNFITDKAFDANYEIVDETEHKQFYKEADGTMKCRCGKDAVELRPNEWLCSSITIKSNCQF